MPSIKPSRRRTDPDDSESHVHRRATDGEAVLALHSRVEDHDRKIGEILETQRAMTENLKKLTENTGRLADVLEAWNNVKGFWWTLKLISSAAKIAVPMLAFVGAVWYFAKTGHWEIKP